MNPANFSPPVPHRLRELLDRALESQLDRAERDEVNRILAGDRDAQRYYVLYMDLHGVMAWGMGNGGRKTANAEQLLAGAKMPERDSSQSLESSSSAASSAGLLPPPIFAKDATRLHWVFSLTVAGMVMLMGAGLFALVRLAERAPLVDGNEVFNAEQPPYVARLTGDVQCRWSDASPQVFRGAHLQAGQTLELESGVAEIAFLGGARFLVEGPSELRFLSPNRVYVQRGKASAVVPKAAVGFSVVSPTAEIIDLGTEFGVLVESDGTTEVEVFAGSVEFQSYPRRSAPLRLVEGESARLDHPTGQMSCVEPSRNRFVRDLDSAIVALPAPNDRLVVNVNFLGGGNVPMQRYTGLGVAEDEANCTHWNNLKTEGQGHWRTIRNLVCSNGANSPVGIVFVDPVNGYTMGIDEGIALFGGHINTSNDELPDEIEIIGLHPLAVCDLYLYSSRAERPLTTHFVVQGEEKTVEGKKNDVRAFVEGGNYVVFRGLMPNERGRIALKFQGAHAGVFSGLQIVQTPLGDNSPTLPKPQ